MVTRETQFAGNLLSLFGRAFRSCGYSLALGFLLLQTVVQAANFYPGTSPGNVPWPGGIVPYEFTNTLTAAEQQTYLNGLREWELAANVHFVPHTTQTHWVLFDYNTNYLDTVSGSTNPQLVTVSSLSRAQVCHEMGHSFGFTHENIRRDSTNYIQVLTNNIFNEPVNIYWFTLDPASVPYGNYDFESVMHLGWDFESINFGVLPTQQPKPPYFPHYQYRMGNFCLSPGDRAALAYLYGPPAVPLTNSVTTTADVGPGSLRAAIYYATDHPGTTVRFSIPNSDAGYSNGVFHIHLTGMLPPIVANGMVIDGSTQPGFAGKPLIFIDGSQIIPQTFTSNTGLLIYESNNQVKNLGFYGFDWNGLTLEYPYASNNTISGCWIGLDPTGTNPAPNAFQGILIDQGASGNTIGGSNVLTRNVLSGNSEYGLYLTDSNTAGNFVLGNYIGTDAGGVQPVPNNFGGLIINNGSRNNTVGGLTPLARNLISGNTNAGIWITDPGTVSNTIQGNWVGLNAAGTAALPNTFAGMYILNGAQNTLVLSNVFSGQPSEGLRLADPGTSFNWVQGNFFGTDPGGTYAIPNNYAGVTLFNGAASNTVGGVTASARNLISGNYYGSVLGDPGTTGNVLEGNFIGVDVTGGNALANGFAGVSLQNGATGNFVGEGNTIAGNGGPGVVIYNATTTNNAVRANSIYGNGSLGIDLAGDGVTPNHTGFLAGPNNFQNYPVLTNAYGYTTTTIVRGFLKSDPSTTFVLDFYRNTAPDPSSYGQGQVYLDKETVRTDASGNAFFSYTNAAGNFSGQYFVATATSAGGDTSEFSADLLATNVPAPSAHFVGPFQSRANGFFLSLALQTNFSYRLQAATNLATPVAWMDLTNITATNSVFNFLDRSATNFATRFYRVISP